MNKYKTLFGAALSTLLFSGAVIAHGVSNDIDGDVLQGHSSDHKDPVLNNPSKAQPPQMGHSNEQDGESLQHQINVHKVELTSSPSGGNSSIDQHHANDDSAPNILHETVDHK